MDSIWTDSIELPHFQALKGNVKTDVLVIGGGITGILCTYFLKEAGVNCILVEGRRICIGVTGNTTAKITSQHGLLYHKLLKQGEEYAQKYLAINQLAIEKYATLCKEIECDFKYKPSYVYSLKDREILIKEVKALETIGFHAAYVENLELPFKTEGAVRFEKQAQFHPWKFIKEMVKNLPVYENTYVTELAPHFAKTKEGEIHYEKAIFATHFPIDNKHGMYFLKMYQHRSYVIALENAPELEGMYVDEARKGMSFRNQDNFMLIGGGDHRTGKTGGNWEELRAFAKQYYPDLKEKFYWAAQDCISLDEVPYIGRYSKNMPECYVATGFNKWGITSAMVSAMLLTDMILDKKNEYLDVFNPSRSIFKPQLFVNTGETLVNFLSYSKKRCPHLGCALKWNPTEHSWDCPCHGSRLTPDGHILDNPANSNRQS